MQNSVCLATPEAFSGKSDGKPRNKIVCMLALRVQLGKTHKSIGIAHSLAENKLQGNSLKKKILMEISQHKG